MKLNTLKYDLFQLRHDPMLITSMLVPLFIWIVIQFIFPLAQNFAINQWNIDIDSYYYETVVFLIPIIPMMFGMVYGFILLDERDYGIITAISVTPMGKSGYLKLRMGLPVIFSFIATYAFSLLTGINNLITYWQIILLTLVLTANAPLMLLFLGAFASNKVEGIAISKGFGLIYLAILVDYLFNAPYDWFAAYSPLFWVERAYFSKSDTTFMLCFTAASLLNASAILLLYRRFSKRN